MLIMVARSMVFRIVPFNHSGIFPAYLSGKIKHLHKRNRRIRHNTNIVSSYSQTALSFYRKDAHFNWDILPCSLPLQLKFYNLSRYIYIVKNAE